MKWLFRKPREPVVQEYLDAGRLRPAKGDLLAECRLIVLDAETSGFAVGTDRLLSVAVIEVSRGEILVGSAKQWFVYQPDADANDAVSVHGILPSKSAAGTPERTVLEELLSQVGPSVIVGHHVGFDVGMLDYALEKHFRVRLHNHVVDTAVLAMHELEAFRKTGYPNQRPPSLDDVCSQLGIPSVERHTAMGDAFTTAEIFLIMCGRMRQRLGRPLKIRDLMPVV